MLTALLAGCNLQAGPPTPPPTPDMPRVQFLRPLNGAQFVEGTEVEIEILAEDDGVGVARVDLRVNDLPYRSAEPRVSSAVPAFTALLNWMALGPGLHSLEAVAFRPDGTASIPVLMIIEVLPPGSESD